MPLDALCYICVWPGCVDHGAGCTFSKNLAEGKCVGLTFAKQFSMVARMSKKQINHIIATLGQSEIEGRVGVGPDMIRHAKSKGIFPANWYRILKEMSDEVGIPCPLSLFNWKEPANKVSMNAADTQAAP